MSDGLAERLEALESRSAIAEVVIRYARAIDRRDEAALRSCFHRGATHRHGAFEGLSSDFCTHALAIVEGLALTHHQLGPVSIALGDETADAETYFTSYHRFSAHPPPPAQPHEDRISGGRYLDRFERRGGVWRIAHRLGVNEWIRYEPAADRGFFSGGS